MVEINFVKNFVLPPYWLANEQELAQVDSDTFSKPLSQLHNAPHFCPLRLKVLSDSGEFWQLPFDPLIAVSGKNQIVKRNVLKAELKDSIRRGSVKELWTQDDYQINIAGQFKKAGKTLPYKDILKLRTICEAREVVEVESPFLWLFNIRKIVIEDYDFPHTKGMDKQMFVIKAVSDDFDLDKLLIQV